MSLNIHLSQIATWLGRLQGLLWRTMATSDTSTLENLTFIMPRLCTEDSAKAATFNARGAHSHKCSFTTYQKFISTRNDDASWSQGKPPSTVAAFDLVQHSVLWGTGSICGTWWWHVPRRRWSTHVSRRRAAHRRGRRVCILARLM